MLIEAIGNSDIFVNTTERHTDLILRLVIACQRLLTKQAKQQYQLSQKSVQNALLILLLLATGSTNLHRNMFMSDYIIGNGVFNSVLRYLQRLHKTQALGQSPSSFSHALLILLLSLHFQRYDTQNVCFDYFSNANPALVCLWEHCVATMFASIEPLCNNTVVVYQSDSSFTATFFELMKDVTSRTKAGNADDSMQQEQLESNYRFSLIAVSVLSLYFMEHLIHLNRVTTASIFRSTSGKVQPQKMPKSFLHFLKICFQLVPCIWSNHILCRLNLLTLQCMVASPTTCLLFFDTSSTHAFEIKSARISPTCPFSIPTVAFLASILSDGLIGLDAIRLSNVLVSIDVVLRLCIFQVQTVSAVFDSCLVDAAEKVANLLGSCVIDKFEPDIASPMMMKVVISAARMLSIIVTHLEILFASHKRENEFLFCLAVHAKLFVQLLDIMKGSEESSADAFRYLMVPVKAVSIYLSKAIMLETGEIVSKLRQASSTKFSSTMEKIRSGINLPKPREALSSAPYVEEAPFFNHIITSVVDSYTTIHADATVLGSISNSNLYHHIGDI
eukprot:CRZ01406.1 hypothetical protein [Spongospora subterranea]